MNARELSAKKRELKMLSGAIREHKTALARRDQLVRELVGEVPRPELAALAQVTPGRISQITEKADTT